MSNMTTPEEFYAKNLQTLQYVDSIVAPGSVVVCMGLVDGRVLYDSLHDHIHPISSLCNDVTYAQFYDYFMTNVYRYPPALGG